jgi:hypothetical protein
MPEARGGGHAERVTPGRQGWGGAPRGPRRYGPMRPSAAEEKSDPERCGERASGLPGRGRHSASGTPARGRGHELEGGDGNRHETVGRGPPALGLFQHDDGADPDGLTLEMPANPGDTAVRVVRAATGCRRGGVEPFAAAHRDARPGGERQHDRQDGGPDHDHASDRGEQERRQPPAMEARAIPRCRWQRRPRLRDISAPGQRGRGKIRLSWSAPFTRRSAISRRTPRPRARDSGVVATVMGASLVRQPL